MNHVVQQENGVAFDESGTRRRLTVARGQVQPAFAMKNEMETGALMAGRRCTIVTAILADMKQRAAQFEPGEQLVGGFFGGSQHRGSQRLGQGCR